MKKLLLITLMLAFGLTGFSQTNESTGSGNWNDNTNWTLGHEPSAYEDVIIKPGHAITVQAVTDAVAHSVDVEGTASIEVLGTLTLLAIPTVHNSTTDETWMDRNLGASQVAASSTDADAYGDLYQWGRFKEGHEKRNSNHYVYRISTAVPNEGNAWDGRFIIPQEDWLNPHDNTLWQGVSGTNNPCPAGFRLPTEAEWDAELLSWASNDAAGAFGSPLKLTVGGFRHYNVGMLDAVDALGFYWSSTTLIDGDLYLVKTLRIAGSGGGSTHIYSEHRGYGVSVRCIKE